MKIKHDGNLKFLADICEMSAEELERRLLIRLASIDSVALKEGETMHNCIYGYTPLEDITNALKDAMNVTRIYCAEINAFKNLQLI